MKNIKILRLFWFIILGVVSGCTILSCSFSKSDEFLKQLMDKSKKEFVSENSDDKDNSSEFIEISGQFNLGSALPSFLQQELQFNKSSRSVFPSVPQTGLTYTATVENVADSTETYEAVCEDNSASYYVRIPSSETEKHFTIKATASYNGLQILAGQSEVFTIDSVNGTAVQDVMLKALKTESGKGIVKLLVYTDTDAGITSARMILTDREGVSVTKDATVSDFIFTFEQGSVSNGVMTDGVKSGSAGVRFEFYSGSNCTGTLCYSFDEVLNVFDNLQTDAWVKNGSENHFEVITDASGNVTTKCHITKEIVQNSLLKTIWVDPSRQTTNTSLTTYTTGTGTFLNPCVSLSAALGKLKSADIDYTIYIKGTLTGGQTIPDTLKSDGTGTTNAHSLTLCGATGVNESGIPQDVLDGNSSTKPLSINSKVSVKIQNLKITKGRSSNGGGISLGEGGSLVLDSGTLVDSNTGSGNGGGGVYVNNGTLTMQGNAQVSNNQTSGSNGWGGGILCVGGAKLILKDNACITGNTGKEGGGIGAVDATAGFYMSDSVKIYSNSGTQGGGVRLWNTTLYMTGGSIYANTSSQYGGGIYMKNGGTLNMSGGVIGGKTDAEKNTATTKGNGLYVVCDDTNTSIAAAKFSIGKSAIITENNDVYLTANAKVTVNGAITPPSGFGSETVTTIEPASYQNDIQVLDLSSDPNPSTTLGAEYYKFAVKDDALHPNATWRILANGKLEKHVFQVSGTSLYSELKSSKTSSVTLSLDPSAENTFGPPTDDPSYTFFESGNPHSGLIVPKGKTLVLKAEEPTDITVSFFSGDGIVVEGTLIINENVNLVRGSNGCHWTAISVKNGGKLILNGGSIKNFSCQGSSSGTIYILSGGTFEMRSGQITGNGGFGGVSVKGTFIMSGGEIKSNSNRGSDNGGGVTVLDGGKFIKTGGTVSGNTGDNGQMYIRAGGKYGTSETSLTTYSENTTFSEAF